MCVVQPVTHTKKMQWSHFGGFFYTSVQHSEHEERRNEKEITVVEFLLRFDKFHERYGASREMLSIIVSSLGNI